MAMVTVSSMENRPVNSFWTASTHRWRNSRYSMAKPLLLLLALTDSNCSNCSACLTLIFTANSRQSSPSPPNLITSFFNGWMPRPNCDTNMFNVGSSLYLEQCISVTLALSLTCNADVLYGSPMVTHKYSSGFCGLYSWATPYNLYQCGFSVPLWRTFQNGIWRRRMLSNPIDSRPFSPTTRKHSNLIGWFSSFILQLNGIGVTSISQLIKLHLLTASPHLDSFAKLVYGWMLSFGRSVSPHLSPAHFPRATLWWESVRFAYWSQSLSNRKYFSIFLIQQIICQQNTFDYVQCYGEIITLIHCERSNGQRRNVNNNSKQNRREVQFSFD